jgi:hypothetical protein
MTEPDDEIGVDIHAGDSVDVTGDDVRAVPAARRQMDGNRPTGGRQSCDSSAIVS